MNNYTDDFRARHIEELGELLIKFGYDASFGEALFDEGMGLFELRMRLECGAKGVGSLAHTHGIRPKS